MAVIHRRSEWIQPDLPMTGTAFVPESVQQIVVHYGATPWPEVRLQDAVNYWRNAHADWSLNKGYALGYGWGIDRSGEWWEIRGFDRQNAANGPVRHNSPHWQLYRDWTPAHLNPNGNRCTISVHCILPLDGSYLPAQILGVQGLVQMIWDRIGREVPCVPHSDVNYTTCPGDPMRAAIAEDMVYPAKVLDPPHPGPQPNPNPEDDAMPQPRVEIVSCPTAKVPAQYIACEDLTKRWINRPLMGGRGEVANWLRDRGYEVVNVRDVDATELARLGPIVGPRPEGVDEWGR